MPSAPLPNVRHYLIHCTELSDRYRTTCEHLVERMVPFSSVRSVHGRTWGLETVKEYDPGCRISPGHVGLLLGHWIAWQVAHHDWLDRGPTKGPDAYVFFEDDVVLCPEYHARLGRVFEELGRYNPEWDLVFLGLAEPDGPKVWNKISERIGPPTSVLCRLDWPWGTHAYMVRPRALPTLLDRMAVAERNADQQLYLRVLKPGLLNWCAVVPGLAAQRTYDHAGTGTPEWAPSTIAPEDAQPAPADPAYVPPTVEHLTATLAVIDPFPCIYRGEGLDDPGRSLKTKRSVPVCECARLDRPCHDRPEAAVGTVTTDAGDAVGCEHCAYRTSMSVPAVRRERLPVPDGHFNPSIVLWGGRLLLATRDSWGHSRVSLWWLDNVKADWTGAWRATQIGSYGSSHPEAPRLEDPRLFVAPDPETGRDRVHCMFNLPDGYPPKRVQVGYVRFDGNLTGIEHTEVFRSPEGNAYEKNWAPFFDDRIGEIRWVYASKPRHTVLGRQAWTTDNPLPWTGGVVRGGAAPVKVQKADGRETFYHFFHGCLKRAQGSVYTVGCLEFEADAPFRVLRQTPTPLLWPTLPAVDELVVKSYVVWPGGAVFHAGAWHLALGIDDCHCRIARIPYDEVESSLRDVPESAPLTSIRDTPLALGVKQADVPG